MKYLHFLFMLFISLGDSNHQNQGGVKSALYRPDLSYAQLITDLDYFTGRIDSLHPNPYKSISRKQFQKECRRVRKSIRQLPCNKVIIEFHRLISLLNDGHTRFLGKALSSEWYPIRFGKFADGFFITATDTKYVDLIGSKLLNIGERPIDSVYLTLLNITPGDNIYGKQFFAPLYFMTNSIMSGLDLTDSLNRLIVEVEKDGTHSTIVIDPLVYESADDLAWFWREYGVPTRGYRSILDSEYHLPFYLKNYDLPYWYEYIKTSKTVYFGFNQCVGDGFTAFSNKLWNLVDSVDAKCLVIDLRNNFGGTNSYHEQFIEEILSRPNINSDGHLFVITGNKTFSAAMHLATWIERSCNAIFAGEPTGARPNHFADADFSYLPESRLLLMVSGKYWENAGPDDMRNALYPDWMIDLSSQDYFNFADPVMERILEYLSK